MESIAQIRIRFQEAEDSQLEMLVREYQEDSRAGVKALLKQVEKRRQAQEKELQRLEQMKEYERAYAQYSFICGIDEVGRGPLAGPVVAGAVILPKDCHILYLNDSKKLSEKQREALYQRIMEEAVAVGIGSVEPQIIDQINILQATYEAMRQAIAALQVKPDLLLNDAVTIPEVEITQVPIIKGDARSVSIAAASIVAKVTRDRMMMEYHQQYPEYDFASNKGYGSAAHREALLKYGPVSIHRRSFLGKILDGQNSRAGTGKTGHEGESPNRNA